MHNNRWPHGVLSEISLSIAAWPEQAGRIGTMQGVARDHLNPRLSPLGICVRLGSQYHLYAPLSVSWLLVFRSDWRHNLLQDIVLNECAGHSVTID